MSIVVMMSRGRGTNETQQLRQQLEDQLDRLVSQLADLEECKGDLDPDEFEEAQKDTIEQLKEFQASLSRMSSGDMTLVDNINAMQLAIQAAISEAFKTPEVIQMFAKKQPDQLREKLSQIERDHKIGKETNESYTQQKVEILSALKKLGEVLAAPEESFLESNGSSLLKDFDKVSEESGSSQTVLEMARHGLTS
ncbi:hypothetical protein SK128_008991 [Halocaridina rubra]|uniref:Beta-catenin-interacting ICAT domain-containing protein n=1 Tax=Halocaridina rubra TaxID=373956 RepID=A0AAN9A1U9_HALRR